MRLNRATVFRVRKESSPVPAALNADITEWGKEKRLAVLCGSNPLEFANYGVDGVMMYGDDIKFC